MTVKGSVAAATIGVLALAARAEMKCYKPDGKIPEVVELIDDEVAFAKYAETADAVAFDRLPRANILHSWRSLGVAVLKTMRNDSEMSPERYRREAGFQAFKDGADGLYLADEPTGEWARALEEAKEDWRVIEYAKGLREKAMASPDGLVRIEGRRATYYLQGFFPSEWENLDTLRLECTAWAKRLEQVLDVPAAKLPTTLPEKPLPDFASFKPYADLEGSLETVSLATGGKAVKLGEGLEFSWNDSGFSLIVETRKGKELAKGASPGGTLDLRLYIPGKKPGEWMPYRFHCDLNRTIKGEVRAPALGRGSFLYGTDERFIPYAQAYAAPNIRVMEWPRLRSHGPDCPELKPSFSFQPVKGGGYRATLGVSWMSLYGRWPMMTANARGDVWYVGVDRSPETGKPVAAKIQWPKANPAVFDKFCGAFHTSALTRAYKEQLARTDDRWMLGQRDRYYGFIKTKEPCFNSGDYESDELFRTCLEQPLVDANDEVWKMVWDDKEHPNPTFRKQTPVVQKSIYKMFGRMFYLSHTVGLLRRDYLAGRFAGKLPQKTQAKSAETDKKKKGPDADFDEDALELDDKEF